MRLSLFAVLPLVAVACTSDPVASPTAAQPLVGVAGSTDAADRDCNVILRTLERTGAQNGTSWVWSGTLEVSTAAAAGNAAPQIEWVPASLAGVTGRGAPTWQTATGVVVNDGTATPGFVKYTVTIDHDAAGPDDLSPFVVAAYVPLATGGRLFDHNRNTGDFDNYQLSDPNWAIYDASGVCRPASSPDAATLSFNPDWTVTRTGILTAGGTLAVHYDSSRLGGCAEVQQGRNQWSITAWLRFDTGDLLSADVLDTDATFAIPTDGPSTASLWFEAVNVDGCHEFDSNENANYVYQLALPPQWVGLPTNTLSRDTSVRCGNADALAGFSFDTWARVEAYETNLCFQVYQKGETDTHAADLWQELDTELHWRFVGGANTATAWASTPVNFDSFIGNNANYIFDWRSIDPFRDYHCPEVTSTPTSDGMYQQISVEYFVTVNGDTLAPAEDTNESEPASFTGAFVDYPSNPWRTANCP